MYGQRPVGPVETISSTPDSRLTRSLQNSRGSPKEIEHFRRGEREVEQHPTLLIRLKAFGENSGSHHERLAHLKKLPGPWRYSNHQRISRRKTRNED